MPVFLALALSEVDCVVAFAASVVASGAASEVVSVEAMQGLGLELGETSPVRTSTLTILGPTNKVQG